MKRRTVRCRGRTRDGPTAVTSEQRYVELAHPTQNSMETILRKYRWVGRLAMIAAVVSLAALVVNHIIAAQLAPLTVPKLPGYKVAQQGGSNQTDRRASSNPDPWDTELTSRCLFGCTDQKDEPKECPGGCAEGKECKDGVCVPVEPQTEQKSNVPVESDLNVKLMGCMVADNPEYSLAMIQDGKSQETYVVGPGDFLPGDARVTRIERDRIYVRRNGRLEFIRLERTIGGTPTPVSLNSAPSPRGSTGAQPSLTGGIRNNSGRQKTGDGSSANPGNSGNRAARTADRNRGGGGGSGGGVVRESSGNEYVLSKDRVDQKLEKPKELVEEVRIIPNFEKGKRSGLKVVGVSPNGLYSQLGLESGDVIHSIDGERLSKQSDAQQLIEGLRDNESFSIVLERNGEKVRKSYKIK